MAEAVIAIPKKPRLTLRQRLASNPVVLKELRGRMRGNRAFVVISVHLGLMSLFTSLLYFAYSASTTNVYGPSSQIAGKVVFAGIVGIELFIVSFIAPAFTAGAISGERERQTYELLRTTLLPARSLVLGKLTSALLFIVLLLFAALPLKSLAFLLGGVAPEEVMLSLVILLATTLVSGSMGIFFSAIMRKTLGASVLTYAFALSFVLGLPLLMITMIPAYDIFFYNYSYSPGPALQAVLIYAFGLLVALNPLATAFFTEMILVDEQSIFSSSYTLNNGATIPLVSPWIPYTIFCFFFSLVLVLITIQIVKRKETA